MNLKNLILFSLIALLAIDVNGKTIDVYSCYGQQTPNGLRYKDIYEQHKEGDVHVLQCFDPGNKECKWTVDPHPAQSQLQYEIEQSIMTKIGLSIYSGTFVTTQGYTVVWDAQSTNYFHYTIHI